MYTRRDQVDAYSFVAGRLSSAILRTDPDGPERPLRRTGVGLAVGIVIGILVTAIVAVVNLFTNIGGGNDGWREPGTLIVAEDTGNRFMMVNGRLRPVLNQASARLLVGSNPKVVTVKTADLADVPRGAPIGILGAPDAIPTGSSDSPWTVCAGADESTKLSVTVGAGSAVSGMRDDQALLVTAGGDMYLAWQGTRLRIAAEWVPRALGLDPAKALAVDSSWLNTLPSGPDIGSPPVERDASKAGPSFNGTPTVVGQLIVVPEAVGNNYFVTAGNGLVPVTSTVSALLSADPASPAREAVRITPSELATQNVLPAPVWQSALPSQPPKPPDLAGRVPCVRWEQSQARLVTAPPPQGDAQSNQTAGVVRDGRVADRVEVIPGAGFLARTRPAPDVPGAGIYLITEAGAKFPVVDADAASALGLPVETARLVPADLLALLPTGPVLEKINGAQQG
ncbi:type VII secretion protein EccB [Saccharopolyspora shandongensis]|uniref:type VII secretion protein EccB n=1 Tax=Saccharopolyspora shandongensis TaxID=418495 RepID=UPI00340ADB38